MFDVKLGGKTYGLEQTWGEYKEFMRADNALDVRVLEARERQDFGAIPQVQEERMALHEARVLTCLKRVDGDDFSGGLDDLSYEVPALLAKKLLNPDADVSGQTPPFGGG